MWCPTCQKDVATQSSTDGVGLICRECRDPIDVALSSDLDTRSARELLERWSQEDLLEPPAEDSLDDELAGPSDSASAASHEPAEPQPPHKAAKPKFRVDGAHAPIGGPSADIKGPKPPKGRRTAQAQAPRPARRQDVAHLNVPAPHFSMEAYISAAGKSPGSSESLWGQILAYLGVGLLTIGTTLVLWGYFGGPVNYAPTGWLVTTAGQMLLFLGVVTLVSGGMQQTTHEVSQRVTYLGEHMLRIEEATQQVLQGPHFARPRSDQESAKAVTHLDETGEFDRPDA